MSAATAVTTASISECEREGWAKDGVSMSASIGMTSAPLLYLLPALWSPTHTADF